MNISKINIKIQSHSHLNKTYFIKQINLETNREATLNLKDLKLFKIPSRPCTFCEFLMYVFGKLTFFMIVNEIKKCLLEIKIQMEFYV